MRYPQPTFLTGREKKHFLLEKVGEAGAQSLNFNIRIFCIKKEHSLFQNIKPYIKLKHLAKHRKGYFVTQCGITKLRIIKHRIIPTRGIYFVFIKNKLIF
jgi:hypothetical protein